MVKEKSPAELVSPFGGFTAGAIAACGAVTFTNPIELIKTRMQLQGQIAAGAESAKIALYKNPIQAFFKIYRNEGIRGLQGGLVCGYYYQVGLNGCRIGFYEPSRVLLTKLFSPSLIPTNGGSVPQNITINVGAGFIAGVAGAVLSNPFFLIKTRMQAYASKPADAIGEQMHYKSVFDGLRTIIKNEGFKGLYRGLDAAMVRTGTGSSVQLSSYYLAKNFLVDNKIITKEGLGLHLTASLFAGVCVAIAMNPWDVVLTRVYNQKGNLYSGPFDCFKKTLKHEGPFSFYRGFWAQLLRIGPHTILTLMFMEHCMNAVYKFEKTFL